MIRVGTMTDGDTRAAVYMFATSAMVYFECPTLIAGHRGSLVRLIADVQSTIDSHFGFIDIAETEGDAIDSLAKIGRDVCEMVRADV